MRQLLFVIMKCVINGNGLTECTFPVGLQGISKANTYLYLEIVE